MSRLPIGAILVELDLLQPTQVDLILSALKERQRGRFGELAVEMGLVDDEGLARALAHQFRLPHLANRQVDSLEIDPHLLGLFPRSFLRRELVVPTYLDSERGTLSLLTADPTDVPSLERMQQLAQARQLRLFVTTRRALVDLLDRHTDRSGEEDVEDSASSAMQLPARRPGLAIFEPEPARQAALRRLQTVEGGDARLLSDPDEVTAVLENGGAWRVTYRQALADSTRSHEQVWRRARPGVRIDRVEGFSPQFAGNNAALSGLLLEALVRAHHPEPGDPTRQDVQTLLELIEDLGLEPARATAAGTLLLFRRGLGSGWTPPSVAGLSGLAQALSDRAAQGAAGEDMAVEALLALEEPERADLHPAVSSALDRLARRRELAERVAQGEPLETPAGDLRALLRVLAAQRATCRIRLSGAARLGDLGIREGRLVHAVHGEIVGTQALGALLNQQAGTLRLEFSEMKGTLDLELDELLD
ncbi:MAG: hypothetical protein VX899_16155 [Myxococcota bacterium]|nr:hypothetical protein [Myxococcota bacterium]